MIKIHESKHLVIECTITYEDKDKGGTFDGRINGEPLTLSELVVLSCDLDAFLDRAARLDQTMRGDDVTGRPR